MRIFTLAAFAALALATPALSVTPVLAQDAQQARPRPATITVSGTGEAELKPDFAHLFVAVETQADTVPKAVEANRTSSEEVLTRIQALGVKKDDIRTENFQVFQTPPRTDKLGNEVKAPKFTANHRLRIKTRDLDGVGRLAGEILGSSNMLFQSVSFGLDRQDEGDDAARRAAVSDAKRQAQVYADAAGVKLGRLLEIRDGSAQPYEAPNGDMQMMAVRAKTADSVPIVPPATLRYTSGVQIVWEIAP
jgi:uncharacterized protein YggE